MRSSAVGDMVARILVCVVLLADLCIVVTTFRLRSAT